MILFKLNTVKQTSQIELNFIANQLIYSLEVLTKCLSKESRILSSVNKLSNSYNYIKKNGLFIMDLKKIYTTLLLAKNYKKLHSGKN